MGRIVQVLSGMGILIGLYLIVANASKTASVINSIGGQTNSMVKTLQGR